MADLLDSKDDQRTGRSSGSSRSRPKGRADSTRPGGFTSASRTRITVKGGGQTHSSAAPTSSPSNALASPSAGADSGGRDIDADLAKMGGGPKSDNDQPSPQPNATSNDEPQPASKNSPSNEPHPITKHPGLKGGQSGTNAAGQPGPVVANQPHQPGGVQNAAQNAAIKAASTGTGGLGGVIVKLTGGNRRRSLLGTIGVVAILLVVGGFIISIPLELEEMSNILLEKAERVLDHTVSKASSKLMSKLAQRAAEKNKTVEKDGEPLEDMMNNMDAENLNEDLAGQGVSFKFNDEGGLIGVEAGGKTYTELDEAFWNGQIGQQALQAMSVDKVLLRTNYTETMRGMADVSFDYFPDQDDNDMRGTFEDKIRDGANANEIEHDTGKDPQQAQQEEAHSATDGTGDADTAVEATVQNFQKTNDDTAAVQAGVDVIKADPHFGITGLVVLVCLVQKIATDAAKNGYVLRTDLLLRASNIFPTIASQMVTGQGLSFQKFGDTMALFSGDANAPAGSEARLGWDQSAAAKRDLGQAVDTRKTSSNFNPDFNPGASPDGFQLLSIVNDFNSVFSLLPGGNLTCTVLNSPAGFFLGLGAQLVELVGNVVDGETEEALTSAADAGIQAYLFNYELPKILNAAAGLAVSDNTADQLFNNADAGLSLSSQVYGREIGGRELTNGEEATLDNSAKNDTIQYAATQGWKWNMVALSNPNSLLSQLVIRTPMSPSQAVADIGNIPHNISLTFGAVFLGLRPAAADNTTSTAANINTYDWQYYGFTDAELNKYDPIANEQFLTQPINGPNGVTSRLKMLGDPSHYDPDNGDDPNNNDLLHCFVDKYSDDHIPLAANPDDPVCSGLGLVTTRDGNQTYNPSDADIVNTIYCKNNGICNLQPNDDFLRYRLELLYIHVLTAIDCETTNQPCFTGNDADSD